jgi:hypothetical protein
MTAFTNKSAKNQGIPTLENDPAGLSVDSTASISKPVTPVIEIPAELIAKYAPYTMDVLQQAREALKAVTQSGKVSDKSRAGLHGIGLDGATVLGWTGMFTRDNRLAISAAITAKRDAAKAPKAAKTGGIMTLEQANQVANITSEDLDAMVGTLHGMSRTGLRGKADIRFLGNGEVVMTAGGNNGKGHYHVNESGQVSTLSASDSSKMKRAFDRSERFARVSDKPENKLTDNDKKFLKEYKLEQNALN